jgi:hypothetical protein
MRALLLSAALIALPLSLAAQEPDEQPAVRVSPDAPTRPIPPRPATPAVAAEPGVRDELRDQSGTTIVGERESPIGLYITPWRNAYAEQDIDRPARLLQVDMSPVDRDVFARQLEYYAALKDATGGKLKPPAATAPPAPPAAPSAAP